GSTKIVSEEFISRARRCIWSVESASASGNTASWLPVSGVSVNTSTIWYGLIRRSSSQAAIRDDRGVDADRRISLVTSAGGVRDLADAALLAEEAGFEAVWATEFYDRSATIALAAMAQATERTELGSAIAY